MTTTDDESAWERLEYALSVQEIRRLGSWHLHVGAVEFLERKTDGAIDGAFANRLSFARYLVMSGRLSA